MGDRFEELTDKHVEFIGQQHLYFVGTAGAEGFVNVSPKGMDSFRIIDNSTVAWMNLTGSGNESAAHVLENGRMTIMFCSFDKQPLILRMYGVASVFHPRDSQWDRMSTLFPDYVGARQIFQLKIEVVQGSCGYAVPFYEHQGERPTLDNWAQKRGRDGIEAYWKDRNTTTINDKDTGIL